MRTVEVVIPILRKPMKVQSVEVDYPDFLVLGVAAARSEYDLIAVR